MQRPGIRRAAWKFAFEGSAVPDWQCGIIGPFNSFIWIECADH